MKLPVEIILEIVSHCNFSTLISVLTCNSVFREIIYFKLYSNITIILNKISSEKAFIFQFPEKFKSGVFTQGLIISNYSKFLRLLTELENNKRLIKYVKKIEINYINFDGDEFIGIDLSDFNFTSEEISLNSNNHIENHNEIVDNFLAEKFGTNNTITKTEVFNRWFIEKYLFQNIIDILSQLTNKDDSYSASWKLILLTLNKRITYHN